MRPLVFVAEGGAQVGAGHLMRCLALAQAASHSGIDCIFILQDEAKHIALSRHDWDFAIISPDEGADNSETMLELLNDLQPAAVVLDGYNLSDELVSVVRSTTECVVVFDDGQLKHIEQADIVVNPASHECDELYRTMNPKLLLATGSAYRLLREEFTLASWPDVEARQGIAICLGGSDPKQLTLPLLQALACVNQDIPVRVVTGPAYQNLADLEAALLTLPYAVQHIHNCQDMAQVWSNARVAVSAAGGSQFELGVCHTPALLLVVAENQCDAAKHAEQEGWCEVHDCTQTAELDEISKAAVALYNDKSQCRIMSERTRSRYDSLGAQRVLDVISEFLSS